MKLEIGKNYYVRTVTDHWIGRLTSIDGPYTLTLENAAWIADSGRLHIFLSKGKAPNMEIEPVGNVTCQWVAILPWQHGLFAETI